jgi:hypothetical protein
VKWLLPPGTADDVILVLTLLVYRSSCIMFQYLISVPWKNGAIVEVSKLHIHQVCLKVKSLTEPWLGRVQPNPIGCFGIQYINGRSVS